MDWKLQTDIFNWTSREIIIYPNLTLSAPASQNGQTHSNNSLAKADALFECVWPFCGIGAESVKSKHRRKPLIGKVADYQPKTLLKGDFKRAHRWWIRK